MKNRLHIIFLTTLFANILFCQKPSFKFSPMYVDEYGELCQMNVGVIDSLKFPFICETENYFISLFSKYSLYKTPKITTESTIYLFSDSVDLSLYAVSDSSIIRGRELKEREGIETFQISPKDSVNYFIVLGGKGIKSIKYKTGICDSDFIDPILSKDNTLKLNEPISNSAQDLSSSYTEFNSQKSRIIDLEPFLNKVDDNQWIVFSVESEGFVPYLRFYDKYGNFLKRDVYDSKEHYSRVAIERSSSVRYAAVSAFSDYKLNKSANYKYVLTIKSKSYNPEGNYWEIAYDLSKNPLIGISIGVFATIFFSYLFRSKEAKEKILGYEELTDKKIIYDESPAKNLNTTTLEIQGVSTTKCCIYEFEFKNIGKKRIEASYRKKPLRLILTNIEKIIFLQSTIEGNGIKNAELISDHELEIDFDFFDVNEGVIVRAICEIGPEYLKGGIFPVVKGEIAEVELIEMNLTNRKVFLFFSILGTLLAIGLIPLLIEIIFDINFPIWIKSILSFIRSIIYPIFILIMVISPPIRRDMLFFLSFPFSYFKNQRRKINATNKVQNVNNR